MKAGYIISAKRLCGSLFSVCYHRYKTSLMIVNYIYQSASVYRISYNFNGLIKTLLLKKRKDSFGFRAKFKVILQYCVLRMPTAHDFLSH